MTLRIFRFLVLLVVSFSVNAIETDSIFYSLPSQAQGHFLTAKKLFPNEKGGVWVQDTQNQIYYFDGQHFSLLPGRAFNHDTNHVTYASGYFWYIDSERLLKVDNIGHKEVVFENSKKELFQAIGQSEQIVWLYGSHHFHTFDTHTGEHRTIPVSQITQGSTRDNSGIVSATLVAGKWVVATNQSLFYLDKTGIRRVLSKQFSNINQLAFDKKNLHLLVGTQSGAFRLNMATIKPDVEMIASGQVQTILITPNDYWVGTKKGLFVHQLDTQLTKHIYGSYQDDLALSSNNIMGLSADDKGGVWIATAKGINYYSQASGLFKRVRFGREKYNLPYLHINDVIAINDRTAWLASNLGLFKVTASQVDDKENKVEKLLDYNVSHISQFGRILWLSQGDKLIRYDTDSGATNVIRKQNKWAGRRISHLIADHQGDIWIANELGLYRYSPKQKMTDELGLEWMVDQYGPSTITSLYPGNSGKFWIGTDHGVYKYNNQAVTFDARSADYGDVISLTESVNHQVWSASGYGLLLMQENDLNAIKVRLPHSNSTPLCVIDSKLGTWVTTTKGIHYYDQTAALSHYFPTPFGIVANEFLPNGCSVSPDGKTLVLTTRLGLVFASTERLIQAELPTNDVLVGEFQVEHSVLMVAPQTNKDIHVNYGRSVSVLFGILPNFEVPQVQYRLLGSEKENWVDFQGSQLTFEHLEPGRYTLELKTISQIGTSHPGTRYSFIVSKPWYLLPSSVAIFALLLIGSIVLLIAWRSKIMVKTNLRLRRLINLKTQQLRHQSQLLVSSNMQLRKQAQTRRILVGERVTKAKSSLDDLKDYLHKSNLKNTPALGHAEQALEPLEQILALYDNKAPECTVFDGQVVSFVVKAVVKGWQQEADKVGITLLVEDSSQGCLVKVKHFNLDMILNTLMASALIRSDANQIIHLSAKLADGRLLISIEDTGEGIAEEEIQAFEAQEFGRVGIEPKFTLSDTSLSAIAQMAEHSGGDFNFHYNQLIHRTRLSISWPVEACIPPTNIGEESCIAETATSQQGTHNVNKQSNNKVQNDWLDKVYQLVEEHYSDPDFSTCHAAKMLFVSERSLQRKFKSLSGGAFMDYVTKVRLEKACELLISGEKISDTAFETGFNDPSYFSQRFKHYFGLSPSKFIENSIE
ncbi:helix-turn-helix domain-containing protein [Vibrio algivorus]|uniref:AraC family transcriptional regulator n=1 Tax=Vibrio algivorus TaxID=1667024 RepID=A0ABQ6ESB4_9VIBR|nr:helix-turn-helix domain-containing protein [Vibrio algivorus]GLT15709.1 AraC family transcriptional regulator [Vibrio algivorus]